MPELLFKLRNVPDDEVQEVCDLLTSNDIDYYQTSAGNWGISLPALWLNDKDQLSRAKALIDQYQLDRTQRERDNYQQLREENKQRTMLTIIAEQPLVFVGCILVILLILYISVMPFIIIK